MLFLLFRIGESRFALEAPLIVEVLPLLDVQRFVQSMAGIAGVLDYRGGLVPVVDLSDVALGRASVRRLSTRIIVARHTGPQRTERLVGLIAEGATELAKVELEAFKPPGIASDNAYTGPIAKGTYGTVQRVDLATLIPSVLQVAPVPAPGIPAMSLPDFEALLKRAIGLDASTIGTSSVTRAVAIRMSAHALDSPEGYYRLVLQSPSELQQLVEAIVVPETWFFRDREAFVAMTSFAREKRQLVQGPFHVLSIPCSTGEEPYSMAMALLDAGFTSEQFRIDAADVSARALAFARRAVYGRNSFRGSGLGFRDHHFLRTTAGYELKDVVRASVRFEHGNLFDPGLLATRAPYHAVFCRNLLIYFDAAGKDKAVRALDRLLDPNGMIFVGPSESSLLLDNGYLSARIPLAFAFRKQNTTESMKARPKVSLPKSGMSASPRPLPVPPPSSAERATPLFSPREPLQPRTPIEDIRRLADEGRLVEAAVRCEEHLRQDGASPEVLLILGLVRDALGEGQLAADCYRKALFLDPHHAQALIHLALLHEKAGNVADAKILHERLQRIQQRSAS